MDDDDRAERGAALARRMNAHNMNPTELAREFDVSRSSLYKIFNGTAGARAYDRLEAYFDRLDARANAAPGDVVAEGRRVDHVTIRLTGNFGVDATVEGPVDDIDAIKQAAKELLREMQREND